ncbi:hypothetical protein [Evansella tamaricis]|uniref:Uncharacterized protein n=1 Tax=Evansella tamaricis TaxID=2069301 RepID=A0ABS6J9F6_9BACI|nr:hypothetical protein [Evansella tamaricis]MBU9710200.1 hypothetical protein [Evansella tamaricis]
MRVTALVLFTVLVLVINGCSPSSEEEGGYDIEGRIMYFSPLDNSQMVSVFVKDNLFGTTLKSYISNTEVPTNYEVEAYKIIIDENTEIISSDTGEPIDLTSDFLYYSGLGQRISIKVDGDFESKSYSRKEYIGYFDILLPIYKAEKIEVSPLTRNDYVHFFSPDSPNRYQLSIIFEHDTQENWELYYKLDEEISELTRRTDNFDSYVLIDFWHRVMDYDSYALDVFELQEYPTFLLLGHQGTIIQTTEWEKVIEKIQEIVKNKEF